MSFFSAIQRLYRRLPAVRRSESLLQHVRYLRHVNNERYLLQLFATEPKRSAPGSLSKHEFQVCSQGGEDGILREIFRRVGEGGRTFVEFGVENGLQNNTHYLLQQGWRGCWLEGSDVAAQAIRQNFAGALAEGQLKLKETFITAENIVGHFRELEVPIELDLLSIDIDGNDYWVWQALRDWRPRVVVIEYNSHFPGDHDWVMPYNAAHHWATDAYFGASLKAYTRLGKELGYRLVGCSLAGTNAFYVRNDLAGDLFTTDSTSEYHYEPSRFFLVDRHGHEPSPRLAKPFTGSR